MYLCLNFVSIGGKLDFCIDTKLEQCIFRVPTVHTYIYTWLLYCKQHKLCRGGWGLVCLKVCFYHLQTTASTTPHHVTLSLWEDGMCFCMCTVQLSPMTSQQTKVDCRLAGKLQDLSLSLYSIRNQCLSVAFYNCMIRTWKGVDQRRLDTVM